MLRRKSSFSGNPGLARLPLRPRGATVDQANNAGSATASPKGRGMSATCMFDSTPKTSRSVNSMRTKDLGFFGGAGDGTQSATVTRHSSNSCSTTCDSLPKSPGSPTPMERKLSMSSCLTDGKPEKQADGERSQKSVALMLAKCMQSSLKLPEVDSPRNQTTTPEAPRSPLSAASGLVLSPTRKNGRRDSEAGAERPLLLPNEFKSRLLQRQGTSPPSLGIQRRGNDSPSSRSGTPLPRFHPERDIRMMDEKEKIFDLYLWNQVLQEEGDGGKVVVCEPKPVHSEVPFRTYVMKMRSKKSLREAAMEEQFRKSLFNLLNLPEHAGVLPLQEVLEDNQFYYIVMEQATGGSFFGGLLTEFKDGVMPPQEVRSLLRGILEAIGHIHEQGMLHRDLKPDNLVMRLRDDEMSPTGKSRQVAIIDFDHADPDYRASAKTTESCEYFCGTVYFSAPEAFLGYFSPASDLYSIGIILYLLMSGKMPFDSSMFQEEMSVLQQSPKSRAWTTSVYKRIKTEQIDWRCDPWPKQPLCCSFCKWLLAFEPGKRPSSAEEALQHEWFAAP